MPDYSRLFQEYQGEGDRVPAIKRDLPIPFVLEAHGIAVTPDGGKYVALCPFHDDSNPSLDVYGEGLERFGCYPCGAQGDVLDLIRRLDGTEDFPTTLDRADSYLGLLIEQKWEGPKAGAPKAPFDFEAARETAHAAELADPLPFYEFLAAKVARGDAGLEAADPDWLWRYYRLGARGPQLIIPYYDRAGQLVTYKYRTVESKALSAAGSDFSDVLYAEWRDTDTTLPVVLCEGESDVWAAQTAMGEEWIALGIPTGVGAHPKQAGNLAGRKVVIAFDGDEAGRAGAVRWFAALDAFDCDVRIAAVPDGTDLASAPDPRAVILGARPVQPPPSGIRSEGDAYVRPGKDTNTPLSDWRFDPQRELRSDDGLAFEGRLEPAGVDVVLSSLDLKDGSKLHDWATRNGGSWFGSPRDSRLLQSYLRSTAPFLPTGRMTGVAGLHDSHFVWPGGRIGTDYWSYVEPANSIHLEDRLRGLVRGEAHPELVLQLQALHERRVMDPILAWLAVAPLRSLMREFPVLAVMGGSGSGKTTMLETVLPAFTGSLITNNLTSTTPHALFSFVGSTNAFPVWFDEYRPGARKDTLLNFQQVLRDAYTGQASSKGGMGERWAEVTSVPAVAPIIVSGEDAFVETSHTERMVQVALPHVGRNAYALESVRRLGQTGFARAYLEWLAEDGLAGSIEPDPWGPADLPGRVRQNLGVLRWGWGILNGFLRPQGVDLGDSPDLSLVSEQANESAETNPILDALVACLEDPQQDAIRRVEDRLHVRVGEFVEWTHRRPTIQLPGGPKAVAAYLKDRYGGWPGKSTAYVGGQKRVIILSASVVD